MRAGHHYQPLSYDLCLPDEAQADALRLLDASRSVVNAALVQLWPYLDEFTAEHTGPAWKQVGTLIGSPMPHGDRQWRCESETAGRIMRTQAQRKQVFGLIQPILSDGFIRPKTDKRPAGKQRATIKEAIAALQKTMQDDETAFVTLQNVVEQACNYFLEQGQFPEHYEQMQAVPLLKVGMLTYAGDDGGEKGQSYRLAFDKEAGTATLRFRFPDEQGRWQWRKESITLSLPACVIERLKEGIAMAPTLREESKADGRRIAVLDVIVQVKKTPLAELKAAAWKLAEDDPKRAGYEAEIGRCWRLYEARNQELAHLAANLLLLFASTFGCSLISGESLTTLKTVGRGKGVRGKWRNWRNNTTIRSQIWHILRYKSHLLGMRFRSENPRGTSHTCPRCGKPAETYRSPRLHQRTDPVKWGRWLVCAHCSYNADRDYCAALNIARLGIAYLSLMQATGKGHAYCVTDASVKPVRYMPTGAVLLFPPQTRLTSLLDAGKIYLNGWKKSATIRSSYATPLLLRLCS